MVDVDGGSLCREREENETRKQKQREGDEQSSNEIKVTKRNKRHQDIGKRQRQREIRTD